MSSPKVEKRYMWLQRQLFDLAYSVNLLANEGTTFTNGAEKRVKWQAEMAAFKAEATALLGEYPQLSQSLDKFWNPPRRGGGRRLQLPPRRPLPVRSQFPANRLRSISLRPLPLPFNRRRPRGAAVRRVRPSRT